MKNPLSRRAFLASTAAVAVTANDAFAQAAWACHWFDAFPEQKDRIAAPNMFHPKTASPAERREFRGFIGEAMAALRDLAAKGK